MPASKGSWTKIATVTALTCICLGLVYGFGVWFDKHYYFRLFDYSPTKDDRYNRDGGGDLLGKDPRVYEPNPSQLR